MVDWSDQDPESFESTNGVNWSSGVNQSTRSVCAKTPIGLQTTGAATLEGLRRIVEGDSTPPDEAHRRPNGRLPGHAPSGENCRRDGAGHDEGRRDGRRFRR